jgi:hypothetical protein
MRSFLLMAAAVLSFSATMTFETTEANAVVCAREPAGETGHWRPVLTRSGPDAASFPDDFSVAQISGAD